jgi:putative nucleotidyltransferase with HDIG domain
MMGKNKTSRLKAFASSKTAAWGLLAVVTALFTITLYPNMVVTRHVYHLGDVADKDIKAPKDFLIEDREATRANRQRAMQNVLTVYDHDTALASKLSGNVTAAFSDIWAIFQAEKEKQESYENRYSTQDPSHLLRKPLPRPQKEILPVHKLIWEMKPDFEKKTGITVSQGAFTLLEKEEFAEDISNQITNILTIILENGVVTNKEILLREIDRGIVMRDVASKTESTVTALKRFYGLDQAKTMVRIIGDPLLKKYNYNLINLIVDFVQQLIQPNITLNRNETEERIKKAAAEIKPTLYRIKKGEMLLREGERVTDVQLLKLKALEAQTKHEQVSNRSVGSAAIIFILLMTTYIIHIRHPRNENQANNKNLVFMASVLLTFFLLAALTESMAETLSHNVNYSFSSSSVLFGIPIAAGAMIVCLFMGFDIALPLAMLIAAFTAVIFHNRFDAFIYFLLSGTMAAYWIKDCRERKVFITAGIKIGFLNVLLAIAINVYMGGFSGIKMLWDSAFAFLGGVGSAVVTLGIAPLVELIFSYTTDITLLELASLDRPILHRLMIEAPGTYHHSVIVGSLVEAAASEIGANPLLAKVGGYYHDIGKLKKPFYFIENQADGINRHDKLEPSMSSLILIAHIKSGVEVARENKLGQPIIDAIRQHHGTSIISYFYERAKQRKGENAVNIDDYRYPGPKPQTREAGLIMLADVVEAASRTLENPTPARIQGLVKNLIDKILSDGQLDQCELTLKDLHKIATSFNKILNGIHHHRIEYTESLTLIDGKGKDGRPDRQQAKKIRNLDREDKGKSNSHLKRLGQS